MTDQPTIEQVTQYAQQLEAEIQAADALLGRQTRQIGGLQAALGNAQERIKVMETQLEAADDAAKDRAKEAPKKGGKS